MTILQIRGDFSDNGPGTQMLTISEELTSRGYKVEVAASGGLLKQKIEDKGFPFHQIIELSRDKRNLFNIISAVFKLRRLIVSKNYDIIHAHNAATLYISYFASFFLKRKPRFFHSCRGIELRKYYQWRNWVYINYPAHIFAVSEYTKKMLCKIGVNPNKISVTYNGVDLKRFIISKKNVYRKIIRDEFNIPQNAIVIGIIGKMGFKGHDEIIKVFAKLENDHDNLYAILVGGGPYMNEFKLLAKKLGVSKRLIFAGIRFEAEMFNAAFDIFALPSYWGEMFPNVLLEAMSMEVPIISTRLSGIPEIFTKQVGYLIAQRDTNDLENKLRTLILNKDLRLKMGKIARSHLVNNFTIKHVVDTIEKEYLKQ